MARHREQYPVDALLLTNNVADRISERITYGDFAVRDIVLQVFRKQGFTALCLRSRHDQGVPPVAGLP